MIAFAIPLPRPGCATPAGFNGDLIMKTKTATDAVIGSKPRALSPERQEERDLGWRAAGKQAHTALGDACQQWSRYIDDEGDSPSQDQPTYHMMFKRMVHARLGIPQATERDAMTMLQLQGVTALENALASEIRTGIAQHQSRRTIKARYRRALDDATVVFRRMVENEQAVPAGRAVA